jgi:hypothetical protein
VDNDKTYRKTVDEPPEIGQFFLGKWIFETGKGEWAKQHIICFGKRVKEGYCAYNQDLQNAFKEKSLLFYPFEWTPSPLSEELWRQLKAPRITKDK